MDSTKLTVIQRPNGPRGFSSASMSRNHPTLTETSPLNIRKTPKPSLSPNSTARSPSPSLAPNILSARSRPTTPNKPFIRLEIPKLNGPTGSANSHNSDNLFESYYGGPNGPSIRTDITDDTDLRTIRPPLDTHIPQPKPSDPTADIRGMLNDLEIKTSSSSLSNAHSDEDVVPVDRSQRSWSDEFLEEISRLGEGAGGAVHKVKDKRTGKIIARKTITTREAPMKQLLRELSIISSTEHTNIILFHGAYMSPSSSEVKILMEFCEGGSLEAVGKRIKDRGAVVGEKIAGRLAEGVSLPPLHVLIRPSCIAAVPRSCKVWRISTPKRLYTGTSSHPTYFCRVKGSSSSAILVFPANSLIPWPVLSPEQASIWLLVDLF